MAVVSHLELSHPSEIYQLYHGCLKYTPSALGPAALGLWVYISGKSLAAMV